MNGLEEDVPVVTHVERVCEGRARVCGLSLNSGRQFVQVLFDGLQDRCGLERNADGKSGQGVGCDIIEWFVYRNSPLSWLCLSMIPTKIHLH